VVLEAAVLEVLEVLAPAALAVLAVLAEGFSRCRMLPQTHSLLCSASS
jgi:hypothetical protein